METKPISLDEAAAAARKVREATNAEVEKALKNPPETEVDDPTVGEAVEAPDSEGGEAVEAADGPDDGDVENSGEAPKGGESEEVSEIYDLSEFGLDDLDKILVQRKINGKTEKVSVKTVLEQHMMDEDYRRRTSELADNRRQAETEIQQAQAQTAALANQAAALYQGMAEMYQGAPPSEELLNEASEHYDPNQYMRQRAAWEANQAKLGQFQQQLAAVNAQMQHQQGLQSQALLQQRDATLSEKWPEFTSSWEGIKADALKHYGGVGVTAEALDRYRERATAAEMLVLKDALAYRGTAKEAAKLSKKLHKVPKFSKGGAPDGEAEANVQSLQKLKSRAAKTGTVEDAVALMRASGRGAGRKPAA